MFQTEFVDEIKTQFDIQLLFLENCVVYEIMCKNMVHPNTKHVTSISVICAWLCMLDN
jgi:hypothetical protein